MTAAAHIVTERRHMGKLLIVEDHTDIAESIRDNLEMEGHAVRICSTGAAAIQTVAEWTPDVVILDLSLPDMEGHHVMRAFRRAKVDATVLVLSARDSEAEKLVVFRLGADDYVTKPFGMLELMARVDVLLKRTEMARAINPAVGTPPALTISSRDIARIGDLVVDRDTRSVFLGSRSIDLAPKEFDLLDALVRRGGAIARRNELLKEVWGYSSLVHSRTLDTHISQLRRKLDEDPTRPRRILTVHKNGYRIDPNA